MVVSHDAVAGAEGGVRMEPHSRTTPPQALRHTRPLRPHLLLLRQLRWLLLRRPLLRWPLSLLRLLRWPLLRWPLSLLRLLRWPLLLLRPLRWPLLRWPLSLLRPLLLHLCRLGLWTLSNSKPI